jgi:DinB superfamily
MKHDLQETTAVLARTPAVLNALLRDLPETWTMRNEGEDSWSAFDVVGHLVDGERVNWMPRARMILQTGEKQTFVPFDRGGNIRESQGKSLAQMLDEFAKLRAANLNEVRALNLGAEDLKQCGRHPAFGTVTLSQLLSTWAVHDLTHLHQISRIMAHQYQEAVGPWKEYLGVLQCTGHGSV